MGLSFPSVDAQRAYEEFAHADEHQRELLVAQLRQDPAALQRQPLFYLLLADFLKLPMKRNVRTAQMDLEDVLKWL